MGYFLCACERGDIQIPFSDHLDPEQEPSDTIEDTPSK